MPVIGVLALQGDFVEHINMLDTLEVNSKEIRSKNFQYLLEENYTEQNLYEIK